MKAILVIDDSPLRYQTFMRIAGHMGILLVITENPEYIEMFLDNKNIEGLELIGICLDHDMPGRNAVKIAEELLGEFNLPVAIVSNNTLGAAKLENVLTQFAVPCAQIPAWAAGREWVGNVLEFFAAEKK